MSGWLIIRPLARVPSQPNSPVVLHSPSGLHTLVYLEEYPYILLTRGLKAEIVCITEMCRIANRIGFSLPDPNDCILLRPNQNPGD